MPPGRTPSETLTLLFTSVGRRVELVQAFRSAAARLSLPLRIIGADATPTAPGLFAVDEQVIVPTASNGGYVDALLDVVRSRGVRALIPTIDPDLPPISKRRAEFDALGCVAMIADADVIAKCRNKEKTYAFLTTAKIDTPVTFSPATLPPRDQFRFPYFLKPREGSASRWVHRLDDVADLDYYLAKVPDPIVQEFVEGQEHTLDVYVGLTGAVRCVVPRARWQVRGGEVSKGVAVKDLEIMNAGRRVVEALGSSVRGVVTLQCIVTADRRIRFIEINPRFGGGAPLGIAAGADYPLWLLMELTGQDPEIQFDGFRHGTAMYRYDWSVFVGLAEDLSPESAVRQNSFPPFP